MKKFSRGLITALVILLSIVSLAACSSSNNSQHSDEAGGANQEAKALNIVNGKIDPLVQITTAQSLNPTVVFKNGGTYDNNIHTKWAKESLGVDIKYLWSAQSQDFTNKLKLGLSSNDPLPDVLTLVDRNLINTLIDSGKVMDIGTAFEKYASETWKGAIADYPEAWTPYTRGDKKYAIPLVDLPRDLDPVLWIRKDWMDKLNLQPPQTIEDVEAIMDAFVKQNPGGQGTFGTDLALKDSMNGTYLGWSSWIFGAYGDIPEIWRLDSEGKLAYGSIQPNVKQGLVKMKEWLDKGYLPQDVSLHDFNKVAENIIAGKVGLVVGGNWLSIFPGQALKSKDPQADFQPYRLPTGPDDKIARLITPHGANAVLLSKDISDEHLQAFFHYANSYYGALDSKDPLVLRGFQEGYDYIVDNGTIVSDSTKVPDGRVESFKYNLLGGRPIVSPKKMIEVYRKLSYGEPLTDNDQVQLSVSLGSSPTDPNLLLRAKAVTVQEEQKEFDAYDLYQGPSTKTMVARNDFLRKMQMDTFTSIIYGKSPLSAFDEFVSKWKSSGGDQITEEVNDWYKSIGK